MKDRTLHWFIISTFVSLYFAVSLISMIHVISFFELSNPKWLAISLSVAFELGAAALLSSIIILEKINKTIVWTLFWVLTLFQAMGNSYHSFVNLHNYYGWMELFGLTEEEPLFQKRILAIISGAILPLVALGFVKSLIDYLKPNKQDLSPKEIYHLPQVSKTINNKEKEPIPVLIKKEKTFEEKMYDSLISEDKQKILDFIKEKTDIVDKDISIIKEEQKKVEVQPLKEIKNISPSSPSGPKGSKWWGKNRRKST